MKSEDLLKLCNKQVVYLNKTVLIELLKKTPGDLINLLDIPR